MSRKTIIIIAIIIIGALVFGYVSRKSKQDQTEATSSVKTEDKTVPVKVRAVLSAREQPQNIEYPAVVVGDQEVQILAQSSGTASQVNFELGDKVYAGKLLVKIDEVESQNAPNQEGFKSVEIRQAALAVEQAEESYKLAKKTYNLAKDDKATTETQLKTYKTQRDLAEISLENAKIALKALYDDHLAISPISGNVVKKQISKGETVSSGDVLAVLSDLNKTKVRFHIDQQQLGTIMTGMTVTIKDSLENEFVGKVVNISPVADETTRRFPVEVEPERTKMTNLSAGAVVSVKIPLAQSVQEGDAVLLPLSAITVGQNENYIFLAENGKAKKVNVTLKRIEGENAYVMANLKSGDQVIIEGNKLVKEGDNIEIRNSNI